MITDCELNLTVDNADPYTSIQLVPDLFPPVNAANTGGNRYAFNLTYGAGTGASIVIKRSGYRTISHRLTLADGQEVPIPQYGAWELLSESLVPNIPSWTRDQICNIYTSFNGIYFNHSVYGRMPLDESCLPWLNSTDRQSVYAAKKADPRKPTHCLIQVPMGQVFYPEWGNYYSPDRFGPLDVTNGLTAIDESFLNLILEVASNGFIPVLFSEEDQTKSMTAMPILLKAMMAYSGGDLSNISILLPGWDGVFYVWDNDSIIQWSLNLRDIKPNVYLGLEFPAGKIPLGEGGADYQPGGRIVNNFDAVLGEYGCWVPYNNPPGDTNWQIIARVNCPGGYNRPVDQPSWDDPDPPNYIGGYCMTPRGKLYTIYFENGVWEFVRDLITLDQIETQRSYVINCGVPPTSVC